MNFRQDGIHITAIEDRIHNLIECGHFAADTMVIDGSDFSRSDSAELADFRRFAGEHGLELWFSATVGPDESGWDGSTVPEGLCGMDKEIAVCIALKPTGSGIQLRLVKDHDADCAADLHLMLDPNILILSENQSPPAN